MLSKDEAREALAFKFSARVESGIDWDDVWVFRAYLPIGGDEEQMNPFFSVNKESGDISDFPIRAVQDMGTFVERFKLEDEGVDKPATPQEALARLMKRG